MALTFGAFRMGYFYGGDGKSVMKVDLRNAAGFMRDAAAVMTNFLLPMKVWESVGLPTAYDSMKVLKSVGLAMKANGPSPSFTVHVCIVTGGRTASAGL